MTRDQFTALRGGCDKLRSDASEKLKKLQAKRKLNTAHQLRIPAPTSIISAAVEGRESSGQVTTQFLGGGDDLLITGFNPEFLVDEYEGGGCCWNAPPAGGMRAPSREPGARG